MWLVNEEEGSDVTVGVPSHGHGFGDMTSSRAVSNTDDGTVAIYTSLNADSFAGLTGNPSNIRITMMHNANV
jgi:hypothetical protein